MIWNDANRKDNFIARMETINIVSIIQTLSDVKYGEAWLGTTVIIANEYRDLSDVYNVEYESLMIEVTQF